MSTKQMFTQKDISQKEILANKIFAEKEILPNNIFLFFIGAQGILGLKSCLILKNFGFQSLMILYQIYLFLWKF